MKTISHVLLALIAGLTLAGCIGNFTDKNKNRQVLIGANDLSLRNIQTRRFETTDKNTVMRSVIATLQDLNFVIGKTDAELGTINADKINEYLKMTVTVRTRKDGILVRASAHKYNSILRDAEMYQGFFNALQRSLFLVAQEVD